MFTTKPLGRFVQHGSKFLWRVGAIFTGVVAAGTWETLKAGIRSNNEEPATTVAPLIAGRQDAWNEFVDGRINLGEFVAYEAISDEP